MQRLFGLTLVTTDVDQTHAVLAETTKAPWPAVQPGRRMTVVRHKEHVRRHPALLVLLGYIMTDCL